MAQGITDPPIDQTDPTLTQPLLGGSAPGGADDIGSQIDALYKSAGISDAGRGGGFADKAYWSEHPSEVRNGRLAADLAGTGTDQPTGTPGRGPWLNSGRNAPEAAIGQPTRTANGGFWSGSPIAPPSSGAGTTWAPGASAPSGAPTGQHWDASQARFVDDSAAPSNPTAGPVDAVTAQFPNLSLSQRQALIAYLLQQQHPIPQQPPVVATAPPLVPPVTTGGGGGGQTPVDPNNPMTNLP